MDVKLYSLQLFTMNGKLSGIKPI